MPPTILNDAVQQVVDKLSRLNDNIHIPEPLAARAREQVRILQTRVAVGKLGPHDRPEVRAAIVLEYVVRQSQSSNSNGSGSTAAGATITRLSLPDLARAVGIKVTHLQELHKMVGNYLQPAQQQRKRPTTALQSSTESRLTGRATATTTIAAPNSQLEKSRRLRSTMTQSANASSDPNNSSNTTLNSRIPDLAIRLAAHVVDPHGFSRQAETLLAAIEHHISSAQTAVHERRGNLYDLQRYRTAYEAACFYHVATTRGQQQGGGGVSKVSARRKGNNHEDNNNNNADDGEDGRQRPLEIADLVEASNDFTYLELKQVLPHVVQLAERIEQEKAQQQKVQQQRLQKEKEKQQKESTSSSNPTRKMHPSLRRETATTTTSKRKQAPDSSATSTATAKKQAIEEMTRRDDQGHAEYDNNHYNENGMLLEESVNDNDVVTFAEWKEQMLSQAIHQAKQDIRTENTATAATAVDDNDDVDVSNDIDVGDDNHDTISYETALERAADTVLQKYGLLSLPVRTATAS
jgi:hypothetical protein